jgi:O-antigen ligase
MKKIEKVIEYGIYLFVFLLPWQTRLVLAEGNLNGYWEYGTFSIYATEILLWAIFLLTAIWWTVEKLKVKSEKLKAEFKSSKLFWIILLSFVFYAFISLLWSDSKNLALYVWHWLVEGIGLFIVLRTIKVDMVKLAWAFVLSATFQAGLGIWQFLSQSTFASKWLGMAAHDPAVSGTIVVETALRRWLRAYGSLPHPNMLAGFLAAGLLLSIWIYQKMDYSFKKLLLSVCFVLLSLGLFVTFSKSVIASFFVALLFLWIIILVRRQPKEIKFNFLKFTLIFLAIAVIFSAVFWEPISTRLTGTERLEIKSTSERLSYFGEAWQIIKAHPFLGVGLGNYTLAVHNEIDQNLQAWDYQPVHNIYLLVLAELGIVGFLLCLTLVFLIIKKIPITNYQLPIFLLFIGLFDHYLWTLYFGVMLFWIYFVFSEKFDSPLDRS